MLDVDEPVVLVDHDPIFPNDFAVHIDTNSQRMRGIDGSSQTVVTEKVYTVEMAVDDTAGRRITRNLQCSGSMEPTATTYGPVTFTGCYTTKRADIAISKVTTERDIGTGDVLVVMEGPKISVSR